MKNTIDLSKERAWVTFTDDNFEFVWHPIMIAGVHVEWHSEIIMQVARERWSDKSFGIAPTSQMILKNAVRDNF